MLGNFFVGFLACSLVVTVKERLPVGWKKRINWVLGGTCVFGLGYLASGVV
jgi:hypothetical protein